jgi:integrase
VTNRKLATNPAKEITIKLGKAPRLRSKGFTDAEATAILRLAFNRQRGGEYPKTAAAKRWLPWLCAYSGARIGEVAQLRRQDIRADGEQWVACITPEAAPVKTKQAREFPLHPHLVEMGFPNFVTSSGNGYLFLNASGREDVAGPLRALRTEFGSSFARS